MLNRSGITSASYGAPRQILANVEIQASVGCIVPQSIGTDLASGKKIAKAGTPIVVDFANRQADVAAPVGPTLGVFTLQITTAFANDESITIEGVTYTKKAAESVDNKQFTGSTAADQITSLLKMVTTEKYDVAAVSGAAYVASRSLGESEEDATIIEELTLDNSLIEPDSSSIEPNSQSVEPNYPTCKSCGTLMTEFDGWASYLFRTLCNLISALLLALMCCKW